jgi:hypothetical protein
MTVVKAQFCGTADQKNQGQPYPWFTFNSIDESLLFYNESVNTFLPIIKKLRDNSTQTDNSKKYAEAYTIFTLFWDQARYVKPGGAVGYYPESPKTYEDFKTRFDEKVKPENSNLYETYNLYMTIFENAYKTFFP